MSAHPPRVPWAQAWCPSPTQHRQEGIHCYPLVIPAHWWWCLMMIMMVEVVKVLILKLLMLKSIGTLARECRRKSRRPIWQQGQPRGSCARSNGAPRWPCKISSCENCPDDDIIFHVITCSYRRNSPGRCRQRSKLPPLLISSHIHRLSHLAPLIIINM